MRRAVAVKISLSYFHICKFLHGLASETLFVVGVGQISQHGCNKAISQFELSIASSDYNCVLSKLHYILFIIILHPPHLELGGDS